MALPVWGPEREREPVVRPSAPPLFELDCELEPVAMREPEGELPPEPEPELDPPRGEADPVEPPDDEEGVRDPADD